MCSIISGYTIDCEPAIGGVKAIFVMEKSNLTSYTTTAGALTALVKAATKRFFKIELKPGTVATATSVGTYSKENGSLIFEQTVSFPINKRDATVRNMVTTLAKNGIVVVTLDMDNVYRAYGFENALHLTTAEGGSGAAPGERQGYVVNLSGQEREDFFVVPNNIGTALETPGA